MSNFAKFYNKIFDYSLKNVNHIKFIDILKSKSIKDTHLITISSKHIYKEMPIRFAQRVTDLNNLPFGLSKNHSVNTIREWYLTSFFELTETKEPNTFEESLKFKEIIQKIYFRHSPTLQTMSNGINELKKENKISDIEAPMIQKFLNKFYTNRTELRILIEQYLSFFEKSKSDQYFGIVNLQSDPKKIIIKFIDDIQNKSTINLDKIINIQTKNNIILPSMDHYLYYIFFELIKNSVQAIIEKQKIVSKYTPQINITITNIDDKWTVFKIDDNGIGIKPIDIEKIWYYSFTTSQIPTSLSGLGYGLPISDIYVNFFNSSSNNIRLESVYKEGTVIYLFLRNYSK